MTTTLAVSSALLLIIVSGRLVAFLSKAAAGQIPGDILFMMVVYRLPSFLELILPLGVFLGILLAYGRLYVESEMTVLRACGMSTHRLAAYTLIPAGAITVIVGFLALYGSPHALNLARNLSEDPKNAEGIHTLVAGRFKIYGAGDKVSYTRSINDDHTEMQAVFVATRKPEAGKEGQVQILVAETGKITKGGHDRYLELHNGHQYQLTPGRKDLEATTYEILGQRIDDTDTEIQQSSDIDTVQTSELRQRQDLDAQATLQWRYSLPVLVPIVALLALALSRTDHRRGRYTKMLPAIIIYLAYLVLLGAVRTRMQDGIWPINIGMWPVHAVFFGLAILLLYSDRLAFWKVKHG